MSSKKTNFIELHCEKILVVIAGLLLAVIAVWQLAVLSIDVKVGSETVSLQTLQEKLVRKEREVAAKLESDSPSALELPEPKKVSTSDVFEHQRTGQIAPSVALIPNQPSFGKLLAGETLAANQWFYIPVFPAGKMQGTVVTTDAFDVSAIVGETLAVIQKESPGFAARYLSMNSADVTWATPWAVIDLDVLRSELAKEDHSKTPRLDAIPRPWFNDTLYIVDVLFERQEKQADGTWSKPTVVSPVPGQESWRPAVQSETSNATNRDTVFANLSDYDMQNDVLQPALLPMKKQNFHAPDLSPQGDESKVDPAEIEHERAEKKIKKSEADLERLDAALKAAGGPLAPPPSTGGGTGDKDSGGGKGGKGDKGGGGGGFGGGFSGGGSMKKNDSGTDLDGQTQASKDKRISLTKKVGQAKKALEKLEAEFAKKYPVAAKNAKAADKVKGPKKVFRDLQSVVAWTHDFDVREGATYQYRTTVKIYNPFFTRKILLVPDQQKLAAGLAVSSMTSQWGADVTIPLATSFFLTRGSSRDGIGGRRLSIDLFRYSNGELRTTSEDLAPGDPVGKMAGSKEDGVDFSTPWYLSDIFDDGGNDANASLFAVFQQRNKSGEIVQEVRTLADKDSEKYKEFKQMIPTAAPKKAPPPTPKG